MRRRKTKGVQISNRLLLSDISFHMMFSGLIFNLISDVLALVVLFFPSIFSIFFFFVSLLFLFLFFFFLISPGLNLKVLFSSPLDSACLYFI